MLIEVLVFCQEQILNGLRPRHHQYHTTLPSDSDKFWYIFLLCDAFLVIHVVAQVNDRVHLNFLGKFCHLDETSKKRNNALVEGYPLILIEFLATTYYPKP